MRVEDVDERYLLPSDCTMPVAGEERALPRLFDPGIAREGIIPPCFPPFGGVPTDEPGFFPHEDLTSSHPNLADW